MRSFHFRRTFGAPHPCNPLNIAPSRIRTGSTKSAFRWIACPYSRAPIFNSNSFRSRRRTLMIFHENETGERRHRMNWPSLIILDLRGTWRAVRIARGVKHSQHIDETCGCAGTKEQLENTRLTVQNFQRLSYELDTCLPSKPLKGCLCKRQRICSALQLSLFLAAQRRSYRSGRPGHRHTSFSAARVVQPASQMASLIERASQTSEMMKLLPHQVCSDSRLVQVILAPLANIGGKLKRRFA